jgi:hypothetical protein
MKTIGEPSGSGEEVLTSGFPVEAGKTYQFLFWIAPLPEPEPMTLETTVIGLTGTTIDSVITAANTETAPTQNIWNRYVVEAVIPDPTSVDNIILQIQITNDYVGSTRVDDIAGFMIVEGDTAPEVYNTGDPSRWYHDITDDVMSANWKQGFGSANMAGIAHEGQMSITVKNDDKKYSPQYSSSPIYDYLKPNRRVQAQVFDGLAWRSMWLGWLQVIDPDASPYDKRTCQLSASHTLNRLQSTPSVPILRSIQTGVEIINSGIGNLFLVIMQGSGWAMPSFQPTWRLDISQLDIDCPLISPEWLFETKDPPAVFFRGELSYTLSDTPHANRIQIYSALDSLAKHELGYVWLTRNGLLRFSERDYFDDLSVNYPVDVDEVGMKLFRSGDHPR